MLLWWILRVAVVDLACCCGAVRVAVVDLACCCGGSWVLLWWILRVAVVDLACCCGGYVCVSDISIILV